MNFENNSYTLTSDFEQSIQKMRSVYKANTLSEADITLSVTKMTEKPMKMLGYKVKHMLGHLQSIEVLDRLKLLIYDAHDTEASHLLDWLNPSNLEMP